MANLLTTLNSTAHSLGAYERALELVSNDTTNSTTPGYAKQTANFEALPYDVTGALAGGVAVPNALSSRDQYAEHNVQVQQAGLNYSTVLASHLQVIEPAFDLQSQTGVARSLNSLFSAFSQLSISPNDAQGRQSVISAATQVSKAFQTTANTLQASVTALNTDVSNTVTDINHIIADLQQLNLARRAAGGNQDPSVDARTYADLETLSQKANISTIQAQDGTFSVLLGGQKALLVGTTAFSLQASTGAGPVSITDPDGVDVTKFFTQGKLGGLIQVRNTLLPGYQSQLDQLASGFADQVNAQLAAGVDKNGNPGAPLFQYNAAAPASTLQVPSTLTGDQIAAASTGNPGGNNNAIALSGLQNVNIAALGSPATGAFSNLSSKLGRDLSNANNDQATQTQLLAQATTLRAHSSGVSLDEEAARLADYQQAYDATSKLISTIQQLTQTLLNVIQPNQ